MGRYGGDEFLVLMPETDREGAQLVGDRLISAIRAVSFVPAPKNDKAGTEANPIPVRLSVGISTYPYDSATRLELISLADTAMYRSKQGGGKRGNLGA